MTSPLVSICIPTYQQPLYFRRTLDSIMCQSFADYEIVITDDSTDDSIEEIMKNVGHRHNLRYFRNGARQGSPENWNEAIRRASGKYIKILHHDDWLSGEHSLASYVQMLENNPDADFAFSSTWVCNQVRGDRRLHRPSLDQIDQLRHAPDVLFANNIIGAPSATLFRRKVRQDFDIRLKWVVDIDFYIRLLHCNNRIVFCDEALVCTTDGAPHQVTAESLGVKSVELFEWLYLYSKLYSHSTRRFSSMQFIWRLLRQHRVYTLQQLIDCGVDFSLPSEIRFLLILRFLQSIYRK